MCAFIRLGLSTKKIIEKQMEHLVHQMEAPYDMISSTINGSS